MPHGIMLLRWRLIAEARARDLRARRATLPQLGVRSHEYSYEAAVSFLSSLGMDDAQVYEGSIPEASGWLML